MFFAPILDHAHATMDPETIEAVLADLGVTEAELRDRRAWFPGDFVDRVCDRLVEASGDPYFFEEVGRKFMTGHYTSTLRPLFRAFGSPRLLLENFPKTSKHLVKTGEYVIHALTDESASLSFVSDTEKSVQVCRGREAQMRWMFPGIFGLPPATVEHPECLHRGDDRCRYELRWRMPKSNRRNTWVLALLGAAAAVGLAMVAGLPVGGGTLLAMGGAALGVWGAWTWSLTRQIHDQTATMLEQDLEVRRGLEDQERRYAELLEAKRDVDKKVERRTQELAQALEEVRELDEVKTRFFANVNHELRTPLQLILAPLEDLIAGREPPGGQAPAFRAMARSATRLHRLVDDLLDLARADAGAESLRRTAVDPQALVDGLVEQFGIKAAQTGIHLQTEVDAQGVVALDTHWIEGALTNLVTNALRHCDPGDTVTLRAQARSGRLLLEVEDTGPGIPAADLPRLFDRFAQSKQKEGAHRGTGLGLPMVKTAAELHDGTASVHSEVGVGTRFSLDLPFVAVGEAAAVGEVPAASKAPSQVGPDASNEPVDDPPVLEFAGPTDDAPLCVVAEDEPDLRRFIANLLAEHYQVVACANGQIGLSEALKRLPDIVVTDMSMPQMTGAEFCGGLRANPSANAIPVIFLTAHQSLKTKLTAYEEGASDYLYKPFHPQELLARVGTHVALRRAQQDLAAQTQLAAAGRMAGEITHLIANPLNTILAGLPVLQGQLPPPMARLADAMLDCGRRIQLVTENLRRLSEDRTRVQTTNYRVVAQLRTAIRLAQSSTPDPIEVAFSPPPHHDPIVRVCQGELDQALQHLLDYAMAAAGPSGTVEVRCQAGPNEAQVTIAHSGPPATDADRQQLLDGVVAADAPTGSASIAMAANLIRAQGGRLTLEKSEAWPGDEFEFTLPLVATDEPVGVA
ncbi:MAG: ATP-binding protein [Myxococcota bacterium]